MENKILKKLKTNFEFMSKVEKKITEVILENPERFIEYSLTKISEKAEVAQGSVINFAHKYANGGFPALKMQIAACLVDGQYQTFNCVDQPDGFKEIVDKTNENIVTALQNTAALNNEMTLKKVADKILSVKKVEIYGIFRSAVVATDFYYQLLQLGIKVSFVADVLTCAVSASMLDSNCLFFAISGTGQTKDVIDAVKIARNNGVFVVSLTSFKDSTLARLSDEVIIASPSGNSIGNSSTEVRFSQLAITDALCFYIRNKIDKSGGHYFKMNDILNLHHVND